MELLTEDWPPLLRFGLPIIISLASFVISYITYRKNKKSLDVTFEDDIVKIKSIDTENFAVENKDGIYLCYLKVVNPSPSDIAYFDLNVIDKKNPSVNIDIYNQLNLKFYDEDVTQFKYETPQGLARLNAPESNYGVFKSNSFTRLEIAFTPAPNTEEVVITFKVAIKSRKNNPYAIERKNFKYYAKTYRIRDSILTTNHG
ncbi:hypothetical protein [Bacillus cereus]|uniref:hypothetical protein n=1 Tax=Bacillus cereus TaxID=1396 RepID=UPI000BEC1335|nr:hypothetical protein [Bacillus cereus]PEE49760.1 hypothetical protein COM80_28995 [Bacillus cereus]PFV63328.1 hypothetical protein COL16_28840 [Bacillus cereus]PGY64367.1 hypothetical protein COE34_28365 [Bacillus cereus]